MKRYIIATVIVCTLGLFSMGALGGLLYYTAYPVLSPFHGNLNDWRGDDVWPATITAGMLWSVGFLALGFMMPRLAKLGVPRSLRIIAAVLVLWLWAIILWVYLLQTMDIRTG